MAIPHGVLSSNAKENVRWVSNWHFLGKSGKPSKVTFWLTYEQERPNSGHTCTGSPAGTALLAEKGAWMQVQDHGRARLVPITVPKPANMEFGVRGGTGWVMNSGVLEPARSESQGRMFNCQACPVLLNITWQLEIGHGESCSICHWNWQTLQIRASSDKNRWEQDETALNVT